MLRHKYNDYPMNSTAPPLGLDACLCSTSLVLPTLLSTYTKALFQPNLPFPYAFELYLFLDLEVVKMEQSTILKHSSREQNGQYMIQCQPRAS